MVNRVLDGAAGAIAAAAGIARHIAWYVSYYVDGTTRNDDGDPDAEGESS